MPLVTARVEKSSQESPQSAARGPRMQRLLTWRGLLPVTAALVGAAVYAVLRSHRYIGDGLRWYPIVTGARPPTGDLRYLLYPTLQYGWFHVLNAAGLAGHDFQTTVARLQILNCLAGGLALGLFLILLRRMSVSRSTATVATILLGLTGTFVTTATDLLEVMPSLPPTLGALIVAVGRSGRPAHWRGPLSAALVTLAGTFYLSAILVAPAVALALFYSELPYIRPSAHGLRRIVLAFLRPGPVLFASLLIAGIAATVVAAAVSYTHLTLPTKA